MEASQIYILIAIVALAIIAQLVFFVNRNKKREKLSKLTILAFIFIIAGICFGDNGAISYIFFGTGVLMAVLDIVIKSKHK